LLQNLLAPGTELAGGLSGDLRIRLATALASELLANDDSEGVSLALDVIGQRPKSSWAFAAAIDLAYYYIHRQRLGEARDILGKIISHQPDERGSYIAMGEVLFREDDFRGAMSYFERAYFQMQGGFEYRKLPIDEELKGRISAAKVYLKLGLGNRAREVMRAAPANLQENMEHREAMRDIEGTIADRQAAKAVLDLAHYLVAQDEVDRALELVREVAPMTIVREKDFKVARRVVNKRWRHIEDPEMYDEGYDESTSVDWGPDEGRPYGREILKRVKALEPKTFMDVGANTGWLTTKVALACPDCQCYGLEISLEKVKMARKRAHMLGVGDRCQFFVGSASDPEVWQRIWDSEKTLCDVVSCTEVIEHVDMPFALLQGIRDVMRDGGTFFCTTPDVEQYQYLVARARRMDVPITSSEGTIMEQMGHVRAYDAHRFVEELEDHVGKVVALDRVDAFQDEETGRDSGDGILLLAESQKAVEGFTKESRGRIDVYCPGFIDWGPRCHIQGFAGGSEQAVAHLMPRLAARGYEVHVYAEPIEYEDYYRGVWWHHLESWDPMAKRDAVMVWRQSALLPGHKIAAHKWGNGYPVLYWAHDVAVAAEESHYPIADLVLALSPYHVKQFADLGCEVRELQNGVDIPALPDVSTPKDPKKVIYGSSADRGLLALLRMWPRVLDAIPDAELHFCYDMHLLRRAEAAEHLYGLADQIEELIADMPSVTNHGGLKHKDFLELAATCGTWAYPCVFPEISCIVAMEMQALGVWPVTTDSSALATTVFGGAQMSWKTLVKELGVDVEQQTHRQLWRLAENADSPTFRGALIDTMINPPSHEDRLNLASKAQSLYDWDRTAELFDSAISEAISGHSGRGLDPK
jgi:2-polyprenyl-3-methyl-5-hydroxy-6-metoxy-1,4-benzoquinol methylase